MSATIDEKDESNCTQHPNPYNSYLDNLPPPLEQEKPVNEEEKSEAVPPTEKEAKLPIFLKVLTPAFLWKKSSKVEPAADQPDNQQSKNKKTKNEKLNDKLQQEENKDGKQPEDKPKTAEARILQAIKKDEKSKITKAQLREAQIVPALKKEDKPKLLASQTLQAIKTDKPKIPEAHALQAIRTEDDDTDDADEEENAKKWKLLFCLKKQPKTRTEEEKKKRAEILNLRRHDRYHRNILHKVALDQDFKLVRELVETAISNMNVNASGSQGNKKPRETTYTSAELTKRVKRYINTRDKFGNTPLILASIHNFTQSKHKKARCINELLLMQCDPNIQNTRTLWTALTWCAFYGDYESIRLLIGAKEPQFFADYKDKQDSPSKAKRQIGDSSPKNGTELIRNKTLAHSQIIDGNQVNSAVAATEANTARLAQSDHIPETKKRIHAFAFWPDYQGLYPLDHYGLQNKVQNFSENGAEIIISTLITQIKKFDTNQTDDSGASEDHKVFLKSALMRSSLLYWTIYFQIKAPEMLETLLEMKGCYAEMPIFSVGMRTCYHACSAGQNKPALQKLFDTREARYARASKELQAAEHENPRHWTQDFALQLKEDDKKIYEEDFWNYIKKSIPHWISDFKKELLQEELKAIERNPNRTLSQPPMHSELLSASQHLPLPLSDSPSGQPAIHPSSEQPKKKESRPFVEYPDKFGNTPLHVASFEGHDEIVEYLLQNNVDYTRKNDEGWRCVDLKQDDKIKNIYLQKERGLLAKLIKRPVIGDDGKEHQIEEKQKIPRLDQKMKEAERRERTAVIPDVVLVFKIGKDRSLENRVNFNISMIQKSFNCYLTQGLDEETIFLMIKMNPEKLMQECVKQNYMVKMRNDFSYQPFSIEKKTEFEPFRSRQRQEITLNSLNRLIDIEQLKQLKVLQNVFLMHTNSGLERITKKWMKHKHWYSIQPFRGIMNFVTEGKDKKFSSITALKIYFGEKFSFYFAWTSFIICYLPFLAFPGLIIFSITRANHDSLDIALPLWVMYNSLFITFLVERWKRKSAEIAVKWGTLDLLNEKIAIKPIRKEYSGDEIVSESTGALTKYNKNNLKTLYFICGTIILLVASAGIILLFLGTQEIKAKYPNLGWIEGACVSAINGVVIQILNMSYAKAVQFFVVKENHKYTDTYESSLIFKTVLFKALTSYLGVFYLTFINRVSFETLFSTLFSLLMTRFASSTVVTLLTPWIKIKMWRGCLPYISFDWHIARSYFKDSQERQQEKVREIEFEGRKRRRYETHMPIQKSPDQNRENVEQDTPKDPKKKKMKEKKVREPTTIGRRRAVLDCDNGAISSLNWEVAEVELNYLRKEKGDILDFYSDALIQFGYITMFAPAFTLGPMIALFLNVLDTRVKLFAFLRIYKRPISEKVGGLGDWLTAWELISILALFVNALSLFFNKNIQLKFVNSIYSDYEDAQSIQLNIDQNINRLWLFAFALHVVLILKVLVIIFIEDKPSWVVNIEEKIDFDEEQAIEQQRDAELAKGAKKKAMKVEKLVRKAADIFLLKRQKNRETDTARIKREFQDFMNKPTLSFGQTKLLALAESLQKGELETKQDLNQQIDAQRESAIRLEPSASLKSSYVRKTTKKSSLKSAKTLTPALIGPSIRIRQAIKSILFNTFVNVEKDLLYKRIADINKVTEEIISTCAHCHKFRNAVKCQQCNDIYCNTCFFALHKNPKTSGHQAASYGKVRMTNKELSAMDGILQNANRVGYVAEYMRSVKDHSAPNYWRKFETFCFPTKKGLPMMPELKKTYDNLQRIYITNNGIKTRDELRSWEKSFKYKHPKKATVLIKIHPQDPKLEGKLEGTLDLSQQGTIRKFIQVEGFNTEEKMFMNEVAFLVFKRKGMRATFQDFLEKLKIIQEGKFQERVELIFELIDKDDDNQISLTEVVDFFKKAFIQNIIIPRNKEEIIKEIFGKFDTISREEAYKRTLHNPNVLNLFAICTQVPIINKSSQEKPPHETIIIMK